MYRKGCLLSVRFNMKCDIIKPLGAPETIIDINSQGELGHWAYQQNEDSGAIERVWIDDPTTVVDESDYTPGIVHNAPLTAHGISDGGIRVAGTTERYSAVLDQVDYIQAIFPKGINVTNRDQVTNIRNKWGEVIWKEEQMPGAPATVFNVMGVIPTTDPFGNIMDMHVLLQRAEVQDASS